MRNKTIHITPPKSVLYALELKAKEDERSVSFTASKILKEYFKNDSRFNTLIKQKHPMKTWAELSAELDDNFS
jgi:hypothetical protein